MAKERKPPESTGQIGGGIWGHNPKKIKKTAAEELWGSDSDSKPQQPKPDGDHIKLDYTKYKIQRKPSKPLTDMLDGHFEPTIYEQIGKWSGLAVAIVFWLIVFIVWRCYQ